MVLPQHNPKDYHKRDPLSFAEGAFKGLTSLLPKGVSVVRQGGTFAVASAFPWLVFGRSIQATPYGAFYGSKEQWLKAIYSDAQYKFQSSPNSTTLYLPAPSAAGVSTINASAGVGGGVHEAGHVICDCANGRFPTFEEFRSKVGRHLDSSIEYHQCDFPKWVNVTADMRLEPGMALEYPEVEHRFHAIQTWCHDLEAEVRGQGVPNDFLMALRDAGKGWMSDESMAVYAEYQQEARDLVEYLKPIWSELKPRNTEWESSAHTPVYVAVEIINALSKLLKEPPPPPQPKGGGGGLGGFGTPTSGVGKTPMSLEDIKRLLEGEGEALDPSKAMEKEVSKNAQHLDHALYIPNGFKPVYRKLL
jgi:hypothetical protein